MSSSQRVRPAWPPLDQQRHLLPWLLSLVLHLVVLILLGSMLHLPPLRGNTLALSAWMGIENGGGDFQYFESGSAGGQVAFLAARDGGGNPPSSPRSLQELLTQQPPVDPTRLLPAGTGNIIAASALEERGVGPGAGAGQALGGRSSGGLIGSGSGKTRTAIFGVPGEGSRFVYVFDRSASTGGPGRNTLSAAKAQLLASLEGLEKIHQFQIIFYNERPSVFSPSGQPGKLVYATEQNKLLARKFIGSITSDGGTQHEEALMLAIQMQPDVIFFLTDADDPKLSFRQLEKIHRAAGGIRINAVEFGLGPPSDPENFMVRLARDNGGRYGYVDITRLFPVSSK